MAALQEQPNITPYSDFKIVVCKRGISLPTHSVIVSLLVNAIVSHPFSSICDFSLQDMLFTSPVG